MITTPAFKDRKYAILGLARSGLSAARSLVAGGAQILAWDNDEGARANFRIGRMAHQGAANQEDGVMAKGRNHAVNFLNRHATRRGRETGLHIAQGLLHGNRQIQAFLFGEGKAPASIGKDRNIRAKNTKQAPEQHGRRHAMFGIMEMRAGEAWMRHHCKAIFALGFF